jgi:hypothetical protein
VLCSGCGATLDAITPELRLLQERAAELAVSEIPLGTRAVMDGTEWEVIGHLVRARTDTGDRWREYLLFNPWEGFIWLIDDEGFWLSTPLTDTPDVSGRLAIVDGQDWQGIRRYAAQVMQAVGEFPWRVAIGETVAVREYKNGGRLLVCEANGEEQSWSQLTAQPHGRIEALFGLAERQAPPVPLPPVRSLWPLHLGMAMAAMLALLLIDATVPREAYLASTRLLVPIDGATTSATLGPFTLPDGPHRVAIRVADSDRLENQWIDLDYELVDRRSQASYPVAAVAEYYRGVDGEGAWAEGDSRPQTTMASIPGGTYDLVIEATGRSWQPANPRFASPSGPAEQLVEIAISRDGSFGDNLFWAGVALFLWPLCLALYALEYKGDDEVDEW